MMFIICPRCIRTSTVSFVRTDGETDVYECNSCELETRRTRGPETLEAADDGPTGPDYTPSELDALADRESDRTERNQP